MHHYINISQLCMEQNERRTDRKQPVMVLCNHSSSCREVMKSCKLLQPIAVGRLYLFRTCSEEHNRLRHCSLPTLEFFKICRFWYSSLTPSNYCWPTPKLEDHISIVSHKISKSCGIISRIRNTLDNSKKIIYYSLIHPYLTYCIDVWSSTYRNNFKTLCTAQKRSLSMLFTTAQQPHSRDIFINQKILPLDILINQQEGIHAYKVINGTCLLNDFLDFGDVRNQIQLINIGDLRIPLYKQQHVQS